jgi:hypothetical protein
MSKTKTDCVKKKIIEALETKRIEAMPALSKFLVLLSIFLLASYANGFLSLSLETGTQVWIIHLI